MVISILSLELSTCMRAHNYEVEVIAYQVGQYTREWWTARMTVDTCTQPPRHCCVPLPGFINCYRISQLDVVQSSCHRGTGNPVGCARWSLPLHIPSLHKLVLLVLCGKAREAQVGWTWLPARLLGLGFCFGQAIRFYYFFFCERSTLSGLNFLVGGWHEVCVMDWMRQWLLFSWSQWVLGQIYCAGAEDFGLHKRHMFPLEVEI